MFDGPSRHPCGLDRRLGEQTEPRSAPMITLHTLPPNLRELREVERPLFEATAATERAAIPPISRYRQEYVRGAALEFGRYALAIERDDALAAGYFELAAECASRALAAPNAGSAVRANRIDVVVDPDSLKTEVSSVPLPGYGTARMSVIDFQAAFFTLAAFGQDSAWALSGTIAEEEYRSPGIVATDNYYSVIRSYKARALGDSRAAVAALAQAIEDPQEAARPDVCALQALDRGDERSFRGSLLDLLKRHKRQAEERPGAVHMLVQLAAMGLCRLALRQGVRIEEQNYLPLRFSPWHR